MWGGVNHRRNADEHRVKKKSSWADVGKGELTTRLDADEHKIGEKSWNGCGEGVNHGTDADETRRD